MVLVTGGKSSIDHRYSPAEMTRPEADEAGGHLALRGEFKPFQGRVVPSETEESIRLPDLEGPSESGILESGNGSFRGFTGASSPRH